MDNTSSTKLIMPPPVEPSELPKEVEGVLKGLAGKENILEAWALTSASPEVWTPAVQHEIEAGTWIMVRVESPPLSIDGVIVGDELVPIRLGGKVRGQS